MKKGKKNHQPFGWVEDLLLAGMVVGCVAWAVYLLVTFWPRMVQIFEQ